MNVSDTTPLVPSIASYPAGPKDGRWSALDSSYSRPRSMGTRMRRKGYLRRLHGDIESDC